MRGTIAGMLIAMSLYPNGILAQEIRRVDHQAGPPGQASAAVLGVLSKAVEREAAKLGMTQATLLEQSQQPGQPRSWPARHPVWTGFLIGAGAGAVLGATGDNDSCLNFGEAVPCRAVNAAVAGGLWGGIGALIGLAF